VKVQKSKKTLLKNDNKKSLVAINPIHVQDNNLLQNFSPETPYCSNGFIMGLCLQGSAAIRTGAKSFAIEKNGIFSIMPEKIFIIEQQSPDFVMEGLCIEFDFVSSMVVSTDHETFFRIIQIPCLKLSPDSMQLMLKYYYLVHERYNNYEIAFRMQITRGLLYSLMVELVSLYRDCVPQVDINDMAPKERITVRFFALLAKYYKCERSMSFYAQELGFSRKYLSSVIKENTGLSALNWLTSFIMTDIKTKLRTTDLTVLQVSEDFNFPNASFFGQFFLKYAGITPYKYKQGYKQGYKDLK
jgi:AraC-like DNA-binding protein